MNSASIDTARAMLRYPPSGAMNMNRHRSSTLGPCLAVLALLLTLATPAARAADGAALPIFDAHLHYNWEPVPHFSLEKVLSLFRENKVTGILATSRPNDGTRALVEAKPKDLWVVPFIRPYRVRPDIQTWMDDPTIQDLIETEYKRGYFRGVCEFHIYGSGAAAPLVKKAVDFAAERDLYILAHF